MIEPRFKFRQSGSNATAQTAFHYISFPSLLHPYAYSKWFSGLREIINSKTAMKVHSLMRNAMVRLERKGHLLVYREINLEVKSAKFRSIGKKKINFYPSKFFGWSNN